MEKNYVDFETLRWEEYDKKSHKIRNNLRHIFKNLNFVTTSKKSNNALFEAVTYLQENLNKNSRKMKNPPIDFIPKHLIKHLYIKKDNEKILLENRYEILIYRMLKKKLLQIYKKDLDFF